MHYSLPVTIVFYGGLEGRQRIAYGCVCSLLFPLQKISMQCTSRIKARTSGFKFSLSHEAFWVAKRGWTNPSPDCVWTWFLSQASVSHSAHCSCEIPYPSTPSPKGGKTGVSQVPTAFCRISTGLPAGYRYPERNCIG